MVTTNPASRVVALEEAFVHPRVWNLFPEPLQHRYQPVRARLSDVGAERIRPMDAAGIDVQVLSRPCAATGSGRPRRAHAFSLTLDNSARCRMTVGGVCRP
jgi:hypothetical protein